jgi:predicted pyridoxine 5'-phosphate oxidase superfamily flavin-nucleotide-binding protein
MLSSRALGQRGRACDGPDHGGNTEGQPYIQHRGGPPGFLHLLDDKTIAFADVAGNRQYITTGNLAENPKGHLFLIDYRNDGASRSGGRPASSRATQD